jgi:hypothetical protein
MSISSIVTRGYGSYSDVTLLPTRGFAVSSEEQEEAGTPMELQPSTNDLYLHYGLNPLFVRLFERG